ncbi:portal protein [Variovorax sp. JS1663]|uniref:portal protein n=1 Tax=Variovorax sp. JS1663 TaxID=1851577 RepID=UPI000B655798|nr:hypothetical protein [Variovorax sp. JS1663]OUM01762.1 hypothetical protein A8M77_14465 [Variovorax sp. JS1663]
MAERMDDEKLLSHLQLLEEDSADFTFGLLASARRASVREYYRRPYGNEEEGWSQIITSDVQDTVEWLLAELLKIFVSSEDAVVFDPTRESEVKGAQQATDACNYVFYKQNPGFLVLYTLFKDALQQKNCAVHWRKETVRSKETIPVRGATEEVLAAAMQDGDEIEAAEEYQAPLMDPATGQPALDAAGQPLLQTLINAKIARITERKVVKVEAFEPENLLVKRDWTSPLLHDCPYVSRVMEVTLSDLHQMGHKDVTAEELAASSEPGGTIDSINRRDRTGGLNEDVTTDLSNTQTEDESQTTGWLRIEWVLVDTDGDGISERREVFRLKERILSSEECPQVPVATGSPLLVQHRWDGMSIAELVSDIQKLRTDLMRGVVNNAILANNPRKTVMVDSNGAPLASIEDLLDGRPGGVVQQWAENAVGVEATPYVGNQMQPLLGYVDAMREQRTGLTMNRMGIDPNALRPGERTLGEAQIIDDASKQRTALIARVFAEVLVKPTFQGILRLLTEGGMEKIAFRLRGEFVELDPNEWRDSYDMTINVGLGTGDKQGQMAVMRGIVSDQIQLAQSPLGPMMITPRQIYNTRAKMLDLQGIKDIGNYYTDPGEAKLPEKPGGPPPEVTIEQLRGQIAMTKIDREAELKEREAQNNFTLQQQNDERDAERERRQAEYDFQIELAKIAEGRYKTDKDNAARVTVAKISHPESILPPGWGVDPETGKVVQGPDPFETILQGMELLRAEISAPAQIVRDPETGRPVGITKGGRMRPLVLDESGRVAGHQ